MITNLITAMVVMIVTNWVEMDSIDQKSIWVLTIEYAAETPEGSGVLEGIHTTFGSGPMIASGAMIYNWEKEADEVPRWKKRYGIIKRITRAVVLWEGKKWVLEKREYLGKIEQTAKREEKWVWEEEK